MTASNFDMQQKAEITHPLKAGLSIQLVVFFVLFFVVIVLSVPEIFVECNTFWSSIVEYHDGLEFVVEHW